MIRSASKFLCTNFVFIKLKTIINAQQLENHEIIAHASIFHISRCIEYCSLLFT